MIVDKGHSLHLLTTSGEYLLRGHGAQPAHHHGFVQTCKSVSTTGHSLFSLTSKSHPIWQSLVALGVGPGEVIPGQVNLTEAGIDLRRSVGEEALPFRSFQPSWNGVEEIVQSTSPTEYIVETAPTSTNATAVPVGKVSLSVVVTFLTQSVVSEFPDSRTRENVTHADGEAAWKICARSSHES